MLKRNARPLLLSSLVLLIGYSFFGIKGVGIAAILLLFVNLI